MTAKGVGKDEVELNLNRIEASGNAVLRGKDVARLCRSWLSFREIVEEVAKGECRCVTSLAKGMEDIVAFCLPCRARAEVAK